jgi:hypothetical protein
VPVEVDVVPNSLRRVGQLTGVWERDPTGSKPTRNADECRRVALEGTDLGSSFFDGERIWFLFGDTWPDRTRVDGSLNDSIAWTTELRPAATPELHFVGGAGAWSPIRFAGGDVTTGVFAVPTGGFSAESGTYVFFTTDHTDDVVMGRSVLGRAAPAQPGGRAFADPTDLTHVYDVSDLAHHGRFINVAPVVRPGGHPGLPFAGGAVLMWGSGRYRRSPVYLAAMPLNDVERHESWWYWSGGTANAPTWSRSEADAARLWRTLQTKVDEPPRDEVGELSVAWIAPLRRWLMTYTSEVRNAIAFRTAVNPWGPWSADRILYEAAGPLGFGELMHRGWSNGGVTGTDALYDRGRGEEGGGAYGGYIVDAYTRSAGARTAEVFFALSTWNPYQVTLMAAQLRTVNVLSAEAKLRLDPLHLAALHRAGEHVAIRSRHALFDDVFDDHTTIDLDPPDIQALGLQAGAPAFIRSSSGARQRNFEVAVPRPRTGLWSLAAFNDGTSPAWGAVVDVEPGTPVSLDAAAMCLTPWTDIGAGKDQWQRRKDRLFVVAVAGDRLVALWRDRTDRFEWHGPFPVVAVEPDDRRFAATGVRGNPAMLVGTFGSKRANIEVVVPDASAGIRHLWMDDDLQFPLMADWRLAPTFATGLGRVDAVSMIQSVFLDGDRGHLEVVLRRRSRLHFCWRGDRGWSEPVEINADGRVIDDAAGVPALIQGPHGAKGRNFELLTPLGGGGLGAYWLDNDADDASARRWHGPAVVDPQTRYTAAALVHGPFGPPPGNLEVVATTTDGRVVHLSRDAASKQWTTPKRIIPP